MLTAGGDEAIALHLRIAQLCEEGLRDAAQTIDAYQKILDIAPSNREAIDALGRLYEGTERWAELVEVTRRQIRLVTDRAQKALLYFKCGSVMESKFGKEDDAIRYYDAAIKTSPSCLPAVHGLRDLYLRRQEWARVIQTLELEAKLWTEDKERAGVYAHIGQIYGERLADPERAIQYYETALQVDRECLPANKALFELYSTRGDYQQALHARGRPHAEGRARGRSRRAERVLPQALHRRRADRRSARCGRQPGGRARDPPRQPRSARHAREPLPRVARCVRLRVDVPRAREAPSQARLVERARARAGRAGVVARARVRRRRRRARLPLGAAARAVRLHRRRATRLLERADASLRQGRGAHRGVLGARDRGRGTFDGTHAPRDVVRRRDDGLARARRGRCAALLDEDPTHKEALLPVRAGAVPARPLRRGASRRRSPDRGRERRRSTPRRPRSSRSTTTTSVACSKPPATCKVPVAPTAGQ